MKDIRYHGILNDDFSITLVDYEQFIVEGSFRDPWRKIAETFVKPDVRVSTVFLGVNHGFGVGRDLWFETMIFGLDEKFEYQKRYANILQARAGHARACKYARRHLTIKKHA